MAHAEGASTRYVGPMYFVPVGGAPFDVTEDVVRAWDADDAGGIDAVVASPLRLSKVPVCH
ncbi:MAG TPA: hypothetical protein VMU14_06625 [Acidimicrobiales bacterium]|nr:hypothetical protein [Acidimicrobiales bacterium]